MPVSSYITKFTRHLAAGFVIAVLILVGVFAALVGSSAGTQFLAAHAPSRVGDAVRWGTVEGKLAGPLRINDLGVSIPGMRLLVKRIELDWRPLALLGGEARVTRLFADGVTLDLEDSGSPAEPADAFDPESLALPINIWIESVAFRELTVSQAGAPLQRIESVDARGHWVGRSLAIESLEIRVPEGGTSIGLDAELSQSMPLVLEASWDWALTSSDAAQDPSIPAPRSKLTGQLRVDGELDWTEGPGIALDYVSTTAGLQALEPELPDTLNLAGRLEAQAAGDSVIVQRFDLKLGETEGQLHAQGRVTSLAASAPVSDITLNWQDLRWPLQASAPVAASPRGELTIRGTPEDYELELAAIVEGEDIPAGEWQMDASGNQESLSLAQLRGRVLGGSLESTGILSWAPFPTWRLTLKGSELDPGELEPAAEGELAFVLATEGALSPESGPSVHLVVEELGGIVAGRPLAGTAEAHSDGSSISLAELILRSEDNTLRATGDASEASLDLRWFVDAANPGALLPGATGRLAANGTLTGSVEAPALVADLEGQDLSLESLQLASVEGNLRLGLAPDAPLTLRLQASELSSDDQALVESVRIEGSGTLAGHTFTVDGSTANEQLSLEVTGNADLETASWRGALEALSLASDAYGNWRLQAPAALEYSGARMALGSSCLEREGGAGAVCMAGELDDEGAATADLRVDALPLEAFVSSLTGSVAGTGDLRLAESGELRADLDLVLSAGDVLVPIEEGTRRLAHQGGSVEVHVDADGLDSHVDFAAPEGGTVNAEIALPGFNRLPLTGEQPLRGRVTMALPKLDALAAWVEEISDVGGRLEYDVQLGGSIATPLLDGGLALSDGVATIPAAGLRLTGIELEVSGDPASPGILTIAGGLNSGGGSASLAGTLDTRTTELDLTLEGERLTVYDTADARAYLSPDLAIGWSDNTLRLRGDLFIPEASITPQLQLRSAATTDEAVEVRAPGQVLAPSPDVVIINADPAIPVGREFDTTAPFRIDSRVRLALGEAVQVRALGFKSRIDGAVTFTNSPGRNDLIPIADGILSLREGTFLAFGQDLEIETGQLIFARVPATEPELNVRAVRWIDNDPQVTAAGVLVTGPATSPVLELFSRPQLEVSEIQSYLLTGTSASERNSVLAVGTYLTPRLYVGYGYNVLESNSEFNSLFSITPRYGVSANAGSTDSNINLTVTYER